MISLHSSSHSNLLRVHEEAIIDYCNERARTYGTHNLNPKINRHFNGIVSNLNELISADLPTLLALTKHFNKKHDDLKKEVIADLDLGTLYEYFKSSAEHFKTKEGEPYNSNFLIKKSNIRCCPYCNENPIYHFNYVKEKGRRNFEWDHFYPQSTYPFLCVSFYNLIPSCLLCNWLKNNSEIKIHPFEKFEPDKLFKFIPTYNNRQIGSILDEISISIKYFKKNRKNDLIDAHETTGFINRYAERKDLVKIILEKKIIYNSEHWQSIVNMVNNSAVPSTAKEMFFPELVINQRYFSKPYSKLTCDLMR